MPVKLKGGSTDAMYKFVAQLKRALAPHADVRQPQRLTTLLLLDLDESVTKQELEWELKSARIGDFRPMGP
jgi:hypothetical protein